MIHLIPDTHVITELCDDGLLVVDVEHARYVFLDAVGTNIWRTLRQTGDVSAATAALVEVYDVDPAELATDVAEFAEYLVSIGLASHEPWSAALPAELPTPPSATAEGLFLDLLSDTLLGKDAWTTKPAEAHHAQLVRDLTSEAARADFETAVIVLPERLGHAAALMAAGVLAAQELWSWRVQVVPDDEGAEAPVPFTDLATRLRLDRLCTWGWPQSDPTNEAVPALVWLPEQGSVTSGWAALAKAVGGGGIIAADDMNGDIAQALRSDEDRLTPLSWRAGWWRVGVHREDAVALASVDSTSGLS